MFDVGIAHATAAPAPSPAQGFISILPLILIFAVFYFLLIRPQQKKARQHQEFLKNLKKGDMIVTNGGMFGSITGMTDTVVTLEVADKVRVKVSRQHILGEASVVKKGETEAAKTGG